MRASWKRRAGPSSFHSLVRRPNGHGQSYALNFARIAGLGRYLCFLDDDDVWTDERLSRHASLRPRTTRWYTADLIFSNQAAFLPDQRKEGPIWLEGLAARLERSARRPEEGGFYRVNVEELLDSGGFCH